MKTELHPLSLEADEAQSRNTIAAVLTIVPGLGHIYKGHYQAGVVWMILGIPIAIWVGVLFGLATAGAGLIFPLVCWMALAYDAYCEKDLRIHHRHLPPSDMEDPQD